LYTNIPTLQPFFPTEEEQYGVEISQNATGFSNAMRPFLGGYK
jgi:hypothetical protein